MADKPYMMLWTSNFLSGVMGMSDAQCGVYAKLIALAWDKDGLSESEVRSVSRDDEAIDSVLAAKFFKDSGGRWRNEKQEEVRKYTEKQAKNGRKGGRPKTQTKPKSKPKPKAKQKPNDNPNDNPNRKPHTQSRIPSESSTEYTQGRNPESARGRRESAPESEQESDQRKVLDRAVGLALPVAKALKPISRQDRQLVARAAMIATTELSERWLQEALGGVTMCPTRKPAAKFRACCVDHAERLHGVDFNALFVATEVPRDFYASLDAAIEAIEVSSVMTPRLRAPPKSQDQNIELRKRELEKQAERI